MVKIKPKRQAYLEKRCLCIHPLDRALRREVVHDILPPFVPALLPWHLTALGSHLMVQNHHMLHCMPFPLGEVQRIIHNGLQASPEELSQQAGVHAVRVY